jgi:GDP-D-mannose dehydratase
MMGIQEKLLMGNLYSKRDWGYAPEYVEGMWRILQTSQPDDYVLATNETHTVKEFIKESFKFLMKSSLGKVMEWMKSVYLNQVEKLLLK